MGQILEKATQIINQAAETGFTWPCIEDAIAKIPEELEEIKEALAQQAPFEDIEAEFGDLILAVVSLCAYAGIDAETALSHALDKFENRFRLMELRLLERNQPIAKTSRLELLEQWKAAKKSFP